MILVLVPRILPLPLSVFLVPLGYVSLLPTYPNASHLFVQSVSILAVPIGVLCFILTSGDAFKEPCVVLKSSIRKSFGIGYKLTYDARFLVPALRNPLERTCAAVACSLMPAAPAIVVAASASGRQGPTAGAARTGPCCMGCTVTSTDNNGRPIWRGVPNAWRNLVHDGAIHPLQDAEEKI